MAEASSSAAEQRDAVATQDAPAALGMVANANVTEVEDDEEWEYEYSATETDTYYLTVEMSLPEFKTASMTNPYRSRGGQYKTWLQNTQEVIKQNDTRNQKPASPSDNGDEPEPEPEPETAVVDDDMADIDPSLRGPPPSAPDIKKRDHRKRKNAERYRREKRQRLQDGLEEEDESEGEEEAQISTEDIQILDLHSKRPVFSYRGHIFEGQWAENVGTEMILTEHDRDAAATLPVLRHLPGDVDLLAASASRILTKEKILKPKAEKVDTLAPIQKEWNINIPKGAYKMSERAGQGNFLERLMALKIKKGEKDHVTVYAKPAENSHLGRDIERPRRRKKSDDEEGGQAVPKRRRRPRGGQGSRGPRGRRSRGTASIHGNRNEERERELSVPTPHRWADLEVPGPSGRENLTVLEQDVEDDPGSDEIESEDEEVDDRKKNDDEDDDEDDDDEDGEDGEDSSDEMDDEADEDDNARSAARTNTAMDID